MSWVEEISRLLVEHIAGSLLIAKTRISVDVLRLNATGL